MKIKELIEKLIDQDPEMCVQLQISGGSYNLKQVQKRTENKISKIVLMYEPGESVEVL